MKNRASKELWKYWVQYKALCLIEGILYRKHQTEHNFETFFQMLVPRGRVSNVLELLHDSPSAGHFGIEKTYKRACESFYWPCMKRNDRNWIESWAACLKRKGNKQKHRHIDIHSQNGNLVINFGKFLSISWVHFRSPRKKINFAYR